MRSVISLFLSLLLILPVQNLSANDVGFDFSKDLKFSGQASEFVFRNDAEETLMPIYLLGAVARPGLYHVPIGTDLLSLLALSGGPLKEAKLDSVKIRRESSTQKRYEFDFNEIVSDPKLTRPVLKNQDVVFIEAKEPAIDDGTMRTIALVSGILGIIVAGFVVKQGLED